MFIPLFTNVHPSMYKYSSLYIKMFYLSMYKCSSLYVQIFIPQCAEIQVEEYYPTFLKMAKNYMEGNIHGSTYEDTCREMFGVHAYLVFTLDRLVQNIVRQVREFSAVHTHIHPLYTYTRTSIMYNVRNGSVYIVHASYSQL